MRGLHGLFILRKKNVIRCLVGYDWGADRTALKAFYTGLVRSVLDGCVVFGSAASTTQK